MDFTTYETFLENLNSVMRGINNLIQEAESHVGLPLVWSPIRPDFVAVGKLESSKAELEYTSRDSILPFILKFIDEDNFVVELTCVVDEYDKTPYFFFSIGH